MQQRNFILFIILSAATWVGWMYLQSQLWPPKTKQDGENQEANKPAPPVWPKSRQAQKEILPQMVLSAAPDGAGLLTAARLAIDARLAEERTVRFTFWELFKKVSPEGHKKLAAASLLAQLPFNPLLPLPKLKPAPAPEGPRTLVLGKGKDYFIQASITTRGGGVRELILPMFQAADDEGHPVFDADGEKVPLRLIRDDPFYASFLLYHYADPKKEESVQARLGEIVWKVEPDTDLTKQVQQVVLSCDQIPGYDKLKIVKRFTLAPKEYHLGLTIEIIDQRDEKSPDQSARAFRYQLSGSHGTPIEGLYYANPYRTPLIGLVDGSGNLRRDLDETQIRISNRKGGEVVRAGEWYVQYAGTSNQFFASVTAVDDKQADRARGGVKKEDVLSYVRPTLESEELRCRVILAETDGSKGLLVVMALDDHFPDLKNKQLSFLLTPHVIERMRHHKFEKGNDVLVSFYECRDDRGRLALAAVEIRRGKEHRPQIDDFTVRVVSNPSPELKPRGKLIHKYVLYHGPAKVGLLDQFTGDKEVDPALVKRYAETLHLRTITDYRSAGWFGGISQAIGWTWLLIYCTNLMHWLLNLLHSVVPVYGLTIIVLTVLVRGLMFPVSRRQALMSIKMQALAPEMKLVQEKYKDDPTKRNQAVMELYRKHGVNPLGSCLPLLLQMPIFLGLYYALQESIHFRLAPFLWIQNLAAPDMLLRWGQNIWYISDPDYYGWFFYLGPYLNLLPVIAVFLMLAQQKMMTPPPADEQQEMQQKMMKYMMIVFGVFFYKVAAGLCLYFIASSLWGLMERRLLPKKTLAAATAVGPGPTPGGGPSGGGGGGGGGKPGGGKPGGRGKQRPVKKEKEPDTAMQKLKNWWQDVLKEAKKK